MIPLIPSSGVRDNITVTVTRTGSCSTTGSDSKSVTVDVVEVDSITPDDGKEVDDGDGNTDTKAYVVQVDTSGSVNVTAKSKPSVAESKLPACWNLSGGTGSGKLTRMVSKTTTAVTILIAIEN